MERGQGVMARDAAIDVFDEPPGFTAKDKTAELVMAWLEYKLMRDPAEVRGFTIHWLAQRSQLTNSENCFPVLVAAIAKSRKVVS